MRKKIDFFALLEEQCILLCKAMQLLSEYCEDLDEKKADAVIQIEEEADMVRRVLIDNMNKTYITPIDREDLFHLSCQLDEIIDYAKTTVDEIRLFKIQPDLDMTKIVATLLDMANHTLIAVKNIEHHAAIARDEAIKVKALENDVDTLTKTAYASLFESDDFKKIFKYTEIYRHLNHTADIADSAMDFLLDILVKM